jgi:hypothetical protein
MGSGTRFETNWGGGARPGGSSQNGPSGTVQDKPPCQTGAPGPTLSSPDQAESSALETALDGGEGLEAGRVEETRAQDWRGSQPEKTTMRIRPNSLQGERGKEHCRFFFFFFLALAWQAWPLNWRRSGDSQSSRSRSVPTNIPDAQKATI